jgi:hypothetical protein
VLSIFGINIPVELVTTWGTVTIILVQLYFFIHLLELSRKLHHDDPGWDVPWLGMYSSLISKMAYFCSAALVPLCAVGIPSVQAIARSFHVIGIGQTGKWSKVVVLIGAITCSALLSLMGWVYRPRIIITQPE